jgi:hypothetical protein
MKGAPWNQSSNTKAFSKARAVASGRPLLCQALDASQYSSNEEGLRLPESIGARVNHGLGLGEVLTMRRPTAHVCSATLDRATRASPISGSPAAHTAITGEQRALTGQPGRDGPAERQVRG